MTDKITTDKEALNELSQWVTRLSIDKSMIESCDGLLQEYCLRSGYDTGGQMDCTPSDLKVIASMFDKLHEDMEEINTSLSKVMRYLDREYYESRKKPGDCAV